MKNKKIQIKHNLSLKTSFFPLPLRQGFTFIDVLVGVSLILIVFLGIFGAYQLGMKVVVQSQHKIAATAIANQWIEKIRNLPYGSIGTQGASLPFAQGVLDSATSSFLNNIEYDTEIKIKYISDSADGTGAADSCDLDYKRIEVKVSWQGQFGGEVKLVTDVAPPNKVQELASCQAQPGGVLSVSIFDAYGQMVSSPLIEIFDPESENLVDSYSPPSGEHDFPLAPSTYKVVVSKGAEYTIERTYGTDEIATPERPHPLVLEGELTEISFSIDKISSFSLNTLSPWGKDFFSDSFEDTTKISELSDLTVEGSEVNLATSTEGYLPSGYLVSTSISPETLLNWEEFSWSDSEPPETDLRYQIYYASGTDWYLIPNADLPGNSEGFDVAPVNLSGLTTPPYSNLKVRGIFSSNSTSTTPTLYDWELSWITSVATPIPNVTFSLRGEKIIGIDENEDPVYKYRATLTSDSSGYINIANLEWDSYSFSVDPATGLDLVDTNPAPQPINLPPDTATSVDLFLDAENSFLLTVQDMETLLPIFAATATLSNISLGYEKTQYTNEKGQTYFIPLEVASYDLTVEAPGYLSTLTTVSVSGDVTKTIKLERVE
jgi:hypothetical protein